MALTKTQAEMTASINLGTKTALSGTSVDFTGLPSGIKRLTVLLNSLSTASTGVPCIQIGDATGGLKTSGYQWMAHLDASVGVGQTVGFGTNSGAAANISYYVFTVHLEDTTNFNHLCTSCGYIDSATDRVGPGAGIVVLSGYIDRVRITTTGGTDTFDGGYATLTWEF